MKNFKSLTFAGNVFFIFEIAGFRFHEKTLSSDDFGEETVEISMQSNETIEK